MGKKDSYFSTIRQSEWGGIDDKLKEIVFHKYFLGKPKGGKYGDVWNEENKNTKKLYDFVSKREFDEYGNIINKVCGYDGKLYPIEEFYKKKDSIDGYGNRCKKNSVKRNRR